jgi:hypothetical protein
MGARADDFGDFTLSALTTTKIVKIAGPGTQSNL